MIVQRAIDTNSVILETSSTHSPSRKHQTFLAAWHAGAIDNQTLAFFKVAVDFYQKMVKNEDVPFAEVYNIARELLKHGEAYVSQVEGFFTKAVDDPKSLGEEIGRCKEERETARNVIDQSAPQRTAVGSLP